MPERRFLVHGWVSEGGDVKTFQPFGTETFAGVWDRAPSGSRWAICSDPKGFVALDLRDIKFDKTLKVQLQTEHRQPTKEAAIACAVMLGNPPLSLVGEKARKATRHWWSKDYASLTNVEVEAQLRRWASRRLERQRRKRLAEGE